MDEASRLRELLREALEGEKGVLFAYLFGSFADGSYGPRSDADLAVMFEGEAPSLSERLAFHHRLAKRMKRELDLVVLNDARSFALRREIATKGLPILDRDSRRREEFELYAVHDWIDFQERRKRLEALGHG